MYSQRVTSAWVISNISKSIVDLIKNPERDTGAFSYLKTDPPTLQEMKSTVQDTTLKLESAEPKSESLESNRK